MSPTLIDLYGLYPSSLTSNPYNAALAAEILGDAAITGGVIITAEEAIDAVIVQYSNTNVTPEG